MIPKECKRLAEVDFPIAVVSKHAAREKSIRHGHPSTLHQWWARRPLAACRAMLLGLLLPDPCDEHCPEDFKRTSRELLPNVQGQVGPKNEDLRKSLFKFIGDFANWDRSADQTYLDISRRLIKAAHPEEKPLVVDPFAGGGSIPLEALRLGCDTFASDLNPVACLILKVLLEDIPRIGPDLGNDLRRVGGEIKQLVERQLADFYPSDSDGGRPIAYLWARTIRCEQPKCGAEIPLVRSFWLCRTSRRMKALSLEIPATRGKLPQVEFHVFEPEKDSDVSPGTVTRAKATCLFCGAVLPPVRVRAQLAEQQGGADVIFDEEGNRVGGARLLAIVTLRSGEQGRYYRTATAIDYRAVFGCQKALSEISNTLVPNEQIPRTELRRISVPLYGVRRWRDLFTARQTLLLATLARHISLMDSNLSRVLACVLSKVADKQSSLCGWKTTAEYMGTHTFSRQALGMVWDFCEANPFGTESGSIAQELGWISEVAISIGQSVRSSGTSQLADACDSKIPEESADLFFTDPPYYDSVPYAHLSDFFYVWLRKGMGGHSGDWFQTSLVPKNAECVVDRPHRLIQSNKTARWFEDKMEAAMAEGRRGLNPSGLGCVVFAHKTTEGWEALLSGMMRSGWTILGSWPITTEMGSRLNARETASLSASVHLICRPRTEDEIGDWGEVVRELPRRVGDWIERLQSEHIRGADLVFACIGPALEIYSRYSKVVDAEDREIPLGGDPEGTEPHKRGYLAYVWEAVGRAALEQVLGTAEAGARNGAAGALEEDARLTALFLWTLQSTNGEQAEGNRQLAIEEDSDEEEDEEEEAPKKKKKGLTLVFDVVRRFAQPLGIHLDNWEDRIIETEKGIVRLLPVGERGAQLFGEDGADLVAERLEREPVGALQMALFPERTEAPQVKSKKVKGKKKGQAKDLRTNQEATTLDRVHAAMLLQANGRTNALRALLQAEQDRGPDFLRLANALSALYPRESEEKRLLDAMLLTVPK